MKPSPRSRGAEKRVNAQSKPFAAHHGRFRLELQRRAPFGSKKSTKTAY
jgi:hypothetical protein